MQACTRLALRRAEKPATKAGQIRTLWPDIEAALGLGQSMKRICAWLAEDAGITLGVTSLTSYISRIRRREVHRCAPPRGTAINTNNFLFRVLKEAGRNAGIQGVTHQMLRRTCST